MIALTCPMSQTTDVDGLLPNKISRRRHHRAKRQKAKVEKNSSFQIKVRIVCMDLWSVPVYVYVDSAWSDGSLQVMVASDRIPLESLN